MKTLPATLALLVALATAATPAASQSHAGAHDASHRSAYAGEQTRPIKALSEQEQRGWLEGQGMGLAKAAELNGYPGPMHVLELADALRLSADQSVATRELMQRHKAEVRDLGAQLVEAERELDAAFRGRQATDGDVERMTARIGTLQARIRAAHLRTHLAQSALLSAEQIALYSALRGYR